MLHDSTSYALRRIEHGMELLDIDEEDLYLTVAPFQRKYDHSTFEEAVELPEKEQGFETSVAGTDLEEFDNPEVEYRFEFNMDHGAVSREVYTDVIYPSMLEEFTDTYPEAEIVAPEAYILDHFFIEE